MTGLLWLFACRSVLSVDGDSTDALERWDRRLAEVVTVDGFVDYGRLEQDRAPLDAYVTWLSSPGVFAGRIKADRHAFWINAYNALAIFQVLERGRPASVLDVEGVLPLRGSGFFIETAFDVGGEFVSLSEIEHERVRMKELDFRDHAALNCASRGCAPLRAGLYRDQDLDAQLDVAMKRWMADEVRGLRFDGDQVVLSPIMDWYARDFATVAPAQSLCSLLDPFVAAPKKARLQRLDQQGCPHRFSEYDWALNEAIR